VTFTEPAVQAALNLATEMLLDAKLFGGQQPVKGPTPAAFFGVEGDSASFEPLLSDGMNPVLPLAFLVPFQLSRNVTPEIGRVFEVDSLESGDGTQNRRITVCLEVAGQVL
jgi:hypothetical protein